jgi:hypothetical protein
MKFKKMEVVMLKIERVQQAEFEGFLPKPSASAVSFKVGDKLVGIDKLRKVKTYKGIDGKIFSVVSDCKSPSFNDIAVASYLYANKLFSEPTANGIWQNDEKAYLADWYKLHGKRFIDKTAIKVRKEKKITKKQIKNAARMQKLSDSLSGYRLF